uniref:Putative deoxyribonuclease TATDN1 isoform X1 n=1 Tax=Rhizophora mucronata TaxID=61149 RepID=A0A2P2L3L6_RHIMU
MLIFASLYTNGFVQTRRQQKQVRRQKLVGVAFIAYSFDLHTFFLLTCSQLELETIEGLSFLAYSTVQALSSVVRVENMQFENFETPYTMKRS